MILLIVAAAAAAACTAERVLEYLPCDVLLIKAAKFGERLPF